MNFRAEYQSELEYLLEVGRAFSQVHSQASHLAERSGDPDVERLLEGFAFLTAKINARLDQAQPALAQSLAQYLAPQHLCPTPACAIVEFRPDLEKPPSTRMIPVGTEVWSQPVHNTPVRFETTQPVHLLEARITGASMRSDGANRSILALDFDCTEFGRAQIAELGHLDLFIHGETTAACNLVYALAQKCAKLRVVDFEGSTEETREAATPLVRLEVERPDIQLLGFQAEHAMLPWGTMSPLSHRILAEYQTLPQKFRQLRVPGLSKLRLRDNRVRVEFELTAPAELAGQVDAETIRLHTTPVRNLFSVHASPISMSVLDRPQRLRAQGLNLSQFEVYDVQRVQRKAQGVERGEDVPSFYDFADQARHRSNLRYSLDRRTSPLDQHLDVYLRLHREQGSLNQHQDVLSPDIRCTNRALASEVRVGEISKNAGGNTNLPAFANLTAPTRPCTVSLDSDLQWRLHASIAANRTSLGQAKHLKALFSLYNNQAQENTAQGVANALLADAIRSVNTKTATHIVDSAPVRGLRSTVVLDERNLGTGQTFLLGQLLDEVFATHTDLNNVHETQVRLHPSAQILRWYPRSGDREIK